MVKMDFGLRKIMFIFWIITQIALSASTTTPTEPSTTTASIPLNVTSSSSSSTYESLTLEKISGEINAFYNLAEEFFEWKLNDFPQFATQIGFPGETDAHLDKLNQQHFEQRRLKCQEFVDRLLNMSTMYFKEEDQLNYDILLDDLYTYINNFEYLKYFTPVSMMNGPQHSLQKLVNKYTVLKTQRDYLKLLSRYSQVSRQIDEMIQIMQSHIDNGLMPSNWSLKGIDDQFGRLQVQVNESAFYEPFMNINLNLTNGQKELLKRHAQKLISENILPSFKKLQDFIMSSYLPATRPQEGISSLPGGLDFYKACLKFHTSTNLTPQEIHDIGLKEVEKINQELSQTAIDLGLPNKTMAEISEILKQDPSQQFNSKEELLNVYRDAVYNKLYPLMDQIVDDVPTVNLTVEDMPSGNGLAYYNDPSADGSRPGTFYLNAKNYKNYLKYEVIALSLHESVPGHHMQAVILIMNPAVPKFRKFLDFYRYGDIPAKFPMNTVYSEGWGLYTEYLGYELGLYEDPYQRLGRHSFELLRACRLVVDTGIHAFNWTRQEAIDYLLQNTAMSKQAIENQIDRYITWPGQACSYKIGEIKIRELRQKAEKELGNNFRLQDFHKVILDCVAPLNILENCVNKYIAKNKV